MKYSAEPSIFTNINGRDTAADLRSYDLAHRTIHLTGEIDSGIAESICAQLRYLAEQSTEDDITLYINSPGGSVSDGMAIYDMMQALPCEIATVGIGMAASMATFLLAAGTPGKRYALPHTEIMIHQPLGGVQGQATDISLVAEHIVKLKDMLSEILAEECRQPKEKLLQDMERDHWMCPQEALEYGLIDHTGRPEL